VGRLSNAHIRNEAERALLIADDYQRRGLGSELARRLIEFARSDKLERVTADVLTENREMLQVCGGLGFHLTPAEGRCCSGSVAALKASFDPRAPALGPRLAWNLAKSC